MLVTFKTLSGEAFSYEIAPETTIEDIIKLLCEKKEYIPENISLFFSGKKLTDKTATLESINYDPNHFLILLNQNKRMIPQIPLPNKKEEEKEKKDDEKIEEKEEKKEEKPEEEPPKPEKTKEQEMEESINDLVAMGFDRSIVVDALQKSNGCKSIALNQILNRGRPNIDIQIMREVEQINERRRRIHSIRTIPAPKNFNATNFAEIPGFEQLEKHAFPKQYKELHFDFLTTPEVVSDAIERNIAERGLVLLDSLRKNPSPMITMLGYRTVKIGRRLSQTPFVEEMEPEIMDALDISPEEAPVIARLARTGVILPIIVGLYRYTGNNEEETLNILMRNNHSHH